MNNEIVVWTVSTKIFVLKDIPVNEIQSELASYIDTAFAGQKLLEFHEANYYKQYCFSGLWPIEKDGVYKSDRIYTVTIRTVDKKLAQHFLEKLRNHYTETLKGLTTEIKIVPKKIIGEMYSLTSIIEKTDKGYWKNSMNLSQFEKRLFENAVKKYNQYTKEKMNEDFQLYTSLRFLNKVPVCNSYKGIKLLGDKIHLQIADNKQAQELAYFMLGTGIGEMNSRGYGFCNFRWI